MVVKIDNNQLKQNKIIISKISIPLKQILQIINIK